MTHLARSFSLRALLALLAGVVAPEAIAAPQGPVSAPPSGIPTAVRVGFGRDRLAGLALGADPAAIASSVAAVSFEATGDGITPIGLGGPVFLVRFVWATRDQATRGAIALEMNPNVVFVEENPNVGPGEVQDCGVAQGAGTQQCTVAFFDGSPTLPEYTDQPALPVIDLGALPAAALLRDTIVAVIDTGVDPAHPALSGRLVGPGFDFVSNAPGGYETANGIDDDMDGLVDEAAGHGTHVAGTIALIDPRALILPLRVLDDEGNGTAWDVALAIRAAGEAECDIINLSLGLAASSLAVRAALDDVDDDAAVIVSAGNGGGLGVGVLALEEDVTAVAAVDNFGRFAWFTSFGPEVDLVAPGVDIYGPMPRGRWARWSGSSMATAVVSGAASRLHSWAIDEEDPEEIVEAILDGALSVDGRNPFPPGWLGRGIVRLGAAKNQL